MLQHTVQMNCNFQQHGAVSKLHLLAVFGLDRFQLLNQSLDFISDFVFPAIKYMTVPSG